MLKRAIEIILQRNHFWRDVGFDELSELYISNMLRSVALSVFMVFVPFYLYQQHYSPAAILSMYGLFFAARAVSDIGAGYYVARYGPKHTMILSCILQIVSASLLLSVPGHHWHILVLALPWGASASCFFIAYHVEFSKIKHAGKAGSELGHMQAYEKIGYFIGPFVGGVIGSVLGPRYIFLAATVLLFASLIPLFQSAEPVKIHQKLRFNDLPVNKIKYDLFANACLGIENTLCINAWSFYVTVFVLTGAVYAQLGGLTAFAVLVSIISAKLVGRISDTSYARTFLRASAISNALTYVVRPFVGNIAGIFAVNTVNEAVTAGYRMPFMKGIYTAADDLPGLRIVYIASMEATNSVAKMTVWFFLAILATTFDLRSVLFVSFAIAGLASLGIMKERFAVYNTGKRA
jgi:MFS family permease